MKCRWIFRLVMVLVPPSLFGQALYERDYLSIDLGGTYSWHNNAPGFYFPYVYEFDQRQPSEAQKFRFVELGDGIGYKAGISLDLAFLNQAAIRFGIRYGYQTTSRREQAYYDCAGNLGASGMVQLETYYKARWQYVGGDMFLRKSIVGDAIYGLIGAGYSYLIGDKLDGEQRIVSSNNDCEYLWLPSGLKSGNTSVAVRDQRSDNLYAVSQSFAKIGFGSFLSLTDKLVLSPEVMLNIPLDRMMSSAAQNEYERQPAATPKLWSTDLTISIRYTLGAPKEKYVAPPAQTTVASMDRPVAAPEPKGFALTGRIRSSANNLPVLADILVTRLDTAAPPIEGKTSVIGYYNVRVPSPGTYSVTASAIDYLFGSTLVVVAPDGTITSDRDIALSPEDGKIRLLVFFEVDKADLREQSYPELDRAVRVMKEAPSMQVEIAGHTDSTGTSEHNLELSKRRADAVRTYLIAKGIRPDRLGAVGYGAAQPVASNSSEPGRAENRRVEFVVRKR